jgi:hypothetical protein
VRDLFRQILLGSSRVVWPAQPAEEEHRITIRADSLLALARAIVALLAYPEEHQAEARLRFMWAMEQVTAAMVPPERRPPELRHLPRKRDSVRACGPGLRRLERALAIAARLPFEIDEVTTFLAAVRTKRRVTSAAPVRKRDILARELAPVMPVIHLALAIVVGRIPEAVDEVPWLAPGSIPARNVDLLIDDRWPLPCIDAAERWRAILSYDGLIEVRAPWGSV